MVRHETSIIYGVKLNKEEYIKLMEKQDWKFADMILIRTIKLKDYEDNDNCFLGFILYSLNDRDSMEINDIYTNSPLQNTDKEWLDKVLKDWEIDKKPTYYIVNQLTEGWFY